MSERSLKPLLLLAVFNASRTRLPGGKHHVDTADSVLDSVVAIDTG